MLTSVFKFANLEYMKEEKIMTIEEVADYLKLSPRKVYDLIREDDLPTITLGERSLRVKLSNLDLWLEAKKLSRES